MREPNSWSLPRRTLPNTEEEASSGAAAALAPIPTKSEIYGGYVGRKLSDLDAPQLFEQCPVRTGTKVVQASVGSHQEGSRAAGWVQHNVVRVANAEGVDEVHGGRRGEVLAERVALLFGDEGFIDPPEYLEVECTEVVGIQVHDESFELRDT